jgi:hypothetical protein
MRTDIDDRLIDRFRADGFLAIPDLLDPAEVAALRGHAVAAETAMGSRRVASAGAVADADSHGDATREAFVQKINLWKVDAGISGLMRHPGLGRMLARLAGVDGLRLYLDQSLCKRPWDQPTAFHVDNPFWAFTARDAISIWIALDDATIANGCLWYLPGSHLSARTGINTGTASRLDAIFSVYPAWAGIDAVAVELPAGGAVVHNGLACHGAGPNLTPRPRRALAGAYMPVGATYNGNPDILPKNYASGLQVGDALADETVHPLVWRAA